MIALLSTWPGACRKRRGTFLGASWGPFADVKKIWEEHFESKSYKALAFGIAGARSPCLNWCMSQTDV